MTDFILSIRYIYYRITKCVEYDDENDFYCISYYLGQSLLQNQLNLATQDGSGLGVIYYRAFVETVKSAKANKRKYQHRWTGKVRCSIGKHTAENGHAAAARKFKEKSLNESTARGFAKLYKTDKRCSKRKTVKCINCNA